MDARSHYSDRRKIDPSVRQGRKPDGTPDDNDRLEIGPTKLAFEEWAVAGLEVPDLTAMRQYRLDRLIAALAERDYAGVLLLDPLNIRYATDTTNMQVWNTHNPFRAVLVTADGHMVLWEYEGLSYLTAFNPLVRETRGWTGLYYFSAGDLVEEFAARFTAEVDDLLRTRCGANRRLAVDKIMLEGSDALRQVGIELMNGEEVTEKTRSIKGTDEIKAIRCAVHACEMSLKEMQRQAVPGITENDLWSVLHAENIKRGGEWIETRLLSSGPRTNPWYQECGPRVIQAGDLVAFDTDLIGCYGMCADISRTWFIGDGEPSAEQKRIFREAHAHIMDNIAVLEPGKPFRDVTFAGRAIPDEFVERRYGCMFHGVGLCDEWPSINYPVDYLDGQYDYCLEPGMVLCAEAYFGAIGGTDGVKLEDQVLITETGCENLTSYPFDDRLLQDVGS